MLCAMTAMPLLFAGACARVVDEDPASGERRAADPLRSLPGVDGDPTAAIPIAARVQVLYGPRRGQTPHGATVWWVVRVLSGK